MKAKIYHTVRQIISFTLILSVLAGLLAGTDITVNAQMSMSAGQMTDVNIVYMSPSSWGEFALDEEGNVWSWGLGDESGGRIARNAANNTTPTKVTQTANGTALPRIKKISNAADNGIFLDVNGDVWTFSRSNFNNITNALGRTVSGTNYARPGKVEFEGNVKITDIAAGAWGFKCIDTNGDIWSWGNGISGAVGNGGISNTTKPERLLTDDKGNELPKFKEVESSDYNNIACAIALSVDGKVYTWGNSSRAGGTTRPKLVEGTPSNIKKIDCSNGGWGFLTDTGELYTWGDNGGLYYGYLGYGNIEASTEPVKLPEPSDGGYWTDFSMYAWSTVALSSTGKIYGCGANEGNSHGFVSYSLREITNMRGIIGKPIAVSQGFTSLALLDSYGNMYVSANDAYFYNRGRAGAQSVTSNAWVAFPQTKSLIKSLTGSPASDIRVYDTEKASLSVEVNRAATEVKYVILYTNDEKFEPHSTQLTVTDTDGTPFSLVTEKSSFYDITYAELEGDYFAKGTNERVLLSPNYKLATSINYANPKISAEIFERAYQWANGSSRGIMTSSNGGLNFSTGQIITENCRIWVQTKNANGTHRMVYEFDNIYKQAKVWHAGVKKDDTGFILYNHELTPGKYGVYADNEGNDITGVPRLGYDIVQPMPKDLTNTETGIAYWILDPSDQTENSGAVDAVTGIQHRKYADKEVVLDSVSKIGNTDTRKPVVEFTYSKNPEAWLDVTVMFVDEGRNPVSVGHDGRTQELIYNFAPKGIAHIDGQVPYVPPEAEDPNIKVVGYSLDPEASSGYTACVFPNEFKPVITSEDQIIYIIFETGMVEVNETFWDITGDVTTGTAIKNNNGLNKISHPVKKDVDTYNGAAPHINGYVAVGYEIGGERIIFDWIDDKYNSAPVVIAPVTENTDVNFLYKKDSDNNNIPDDEEGFAKVHWIGVSSSGSKVTLHNTVFAGNGVKGDIKTYFNSNGDKEIYIVSNPQKWILNQNAEGFVPAGSSAPLTVSYEKGTTKDYYLYYDEDYNENNVPDKDEKITKKFRLYGDYNNELRPDAAGKILAGEPYTEIAPYIAGYIAVGWIHGEYIAGLSDYEIHHITENGEIPEAGFETDIDDVNETVTFIYKEAAKPVIVNWVGVTYGGNIVSFDTVVINGYVGESVTHLIFPAQDINSEMWQLESSDIPSDVILSSYAQNYEYRYRERIDFAIISISGESTDGKLNFSYTQQKKLDDNAFEVIAWPLPGYKVTEYTVTDVYGNGIEAGEGGMAVIDPSKGSQNVKFTYVSMITTVVVKAVDEYGKELYSNVFTDANVGEKYSVTAPHIDGYTLDNGQDILRVLDPVQEGTNTAIFYYTKTSELQKLLVLQETGGDIIRVIEFNAGETVQYPPDLTSAYYTFDEQGTALTFPYVMNDSATVYYTKDLMNVTIKAVDSEDFPIGTDITDKARKGEMYKASAHAVQGYTLTEQPTKLVYANPNTEPQDIIFKYKADELGDITVKYFYRDEKGTAVDLYVYTGKCIIGSKFIAAAGEFEGFEIKSGEPTEKEITISNDNLVEFEYTDIRKIVNICTKLDESAENDYEQKRYAIGSEDIIHPPYINGYVLTGYIVDSGEAVYVDNTFTGIDFTGENKITDSHIITFIYKAIDEVITDSYATAKIVCYDSLTGEEFYSKSIDSLIAGKEFTPTIPDMTAKGYTEGIPDASNPTILIAGENIYRFMYEKDYTKWSIVSVKAVYSDSTDVSLSYYTKPKDILVLNGTDYTASAPIVNWHSLTGTETKTVYVTENITIPFEYVPVQQNIEVRAVDESGNILQVNRYSAVVNSSHTYYAADEFANITVWQLNDSESKQLTVSDGQNIVEFRYTRNARNIIVILKDENNITLSTQSVENIGIGETVNINAPHIEGYVLDMSKGSASISVTMPEGTGNYEITFFYKRSVSITDVTVIGMADGKELYRYVISGDAGASKTVTAISVANHTALAQSQTVIFGTDTELIFEYTSNIKTVTIEARDTNGNPVVGYVSKQYSIAAGNSYYAYAPVIEGWVISDGIYETVKTITDNEVITFTYKKDENMLLIKAVDEFGNTIKVVGKTLDNGVHTIYADELGSITGWILDYPMSIDVTIPDNKEAIFVYKKNTAVVTIKGYDNESGAELFSREFTGVQKGTQFTGSMEFVPGFSLMYGEEISKTITIVDDSVISFMYVKTMANVRTIHKTTAGNILMIEDDTAAALSEYTARAKVFTGYKLQNEAVQTTVIPEFGEYIFTFLYEINTAEIMVKLVDISRNTLVDSYTVTAQIGVLTTINAPALAGYVIEGEDKQTFIPEPQSEITFYYEKISDIVEGSYFTLYVTGTNADNFSQLYSYPLKLEKSGGLYSLNAFIIEGYELVGIGTEYIPMDGSITSIDFKYKSLKRTVTINAKDSNGISLAAPQTVTGTVGETLVLNAQLITDYELVNEASKTHVVDNDITKNNITFIYTKMKGNVIFRYVDENNTDTIIYQISQNIEVGTPLNEIEDPAVTLPVGWKLTDNDRSESNSTVTSSTQSIITYKLTKDMKEIVVNYYQKGTEYKVADSTIQTAQYGASNVTVIARPDNLQSGYVLDGAPYQTVSKVDNTNAVNFYYEDRSSTGAGAVTIIAKDKESGNVISYNISAAIPLGSAYNAEAPAITGWKNGNWLNTSHPLSGTMTALGVTIIFEYEMDIADIPVYITDEDGNILAGAEYEDAAINLYTVQSVQAGSNIIVYAPHFTGYEVVGNGYTELANVDSSMSVTFTYKTALDLTPPPTPTPDKKGTIIITVSDSSSGNPISNANIEINHNAYRQTYTTDSYGKVTITDALYGRYTIKAGYSGYNTGTAVIDLSETENLINVQITIAKIQSPGGGGPIIIYPTNPEPNILPPAPETKPDIEPEPKPETNTETETVLEMDSHIKYVSGYPDGSFRPDSGITRAEAALIFFKLYKEETKNLYVSPKFSDVGRGKWYSQGVNFLASKGILKGYGDGSFRPDQKVTRAEFATIVSMFNELSETKGVIFKDVPAGHWAEKYISSAYSKGWISGYPNGKYEPERFISRAEAVKIINAMLNRKIETGNIPKGAMRYNDVSSSHWAYSDIIEASTDHEYTRNENGYEIWK